MADRIQRLPLKIFTPIDPLIQHLVKGNAYDRVGAVKLWEALQALSKAVVELTTAAQVPASGSTDFYEDSLYFATRSALDIISGAGIEVSAQDDVAAAIARYTIKNTFYPAGIGTGGIFGAILNQRPNQPSFTPFGSTTAATPLPQVEDFICPADGWAVAPLVRHGSESGSGIAQRLGFNRNGSFFWDGIIEPQSAAGISDDDGLTFTRYKRGDLMMGAFHATGSSVNTSFGPWTAEFIGDGGECIMGGPVLGAAGTTAYCGPYHNGNATTETQVRMPMIAGTVKWAYLKLNANLTGPATGQSATLKFWKNGADPGSSISITVPEVNGSAGGADNSVWVDLTNTVTFAKGDTLSFEITVSAGTVGALQGQLSFVIVPTTSTHKILGGFLRDNLTATTLYMAPFCRANGVWAQTETNCLMVCNRAFTIPADGLMLNVYTALTGGSQQTFQIRKNQSNNGPSIVLTSASGTGVKTSTGSSVSFVKGDLFSLSNANSGGATGAVAGWSVLYTT